MSGPIKVTVGQALRSCAAGLRGLNDAQLCELAVLWKARSGSSLSPAVLKNLLEDLLDLGELMP